MSLERTERKDLADSAVEPSAPAFAIQSSHRDIFSMIDSSGGAVALCSDDTLPSCLRESLPAFSNVVGGKVGELISGASRDSVPGVPGGAVARDFVPGGAVARDSMPGGAVARDSGATSPEPKGLHYVEPELLADGKTPKLPKNLCSFLVSEYLAARLNAEKDDGPPPWLMKALRDPKKLAKELGDKYGGRGGRPAGRR